MKFRCPRCAQPGVEPATYFFDDFRKNNRCVLCAAPLTRRRYISPLVTDAVFGGGFLACIALIVSWAKGSVAWMAGVAAASISVCLLARGAEMLFAPLEDQESEGYLRRTQRNRRLGNWALLGFGVIAIIATLYTIKK